MSSIVVYSPFYADAAGEPANSALIDALSRALYARDRKTHEHAERVRLLGRMRAMTTTGRFSEDRSAGRFQTSDRGGR